MRVLVLLASQTARGAEIQGSQLTQRLRDAGVEATVRALHRSPEPHLPHMAPLGDTPLGRDTLQALRRTARKHDVVVAYGSKTLRASALALAGTGVPFVYQSIGNPMDWVRGHVHHRITTALFRRASVVVVLWPGAARSVVDQLGVPPGRVQVIPNARDAASFPVTSPAMRRDARTSLGLASEAPIAAVVGSLQPEKQVEIAIGAMDGLPRHRLVVAGDGPRRQQLEALAERSAPGRVTFMGHVSDVAPVLHAADVLLMPSSTEGMPGVAIEAVMTGIPVVATAVGALPEMPGVTTVQASPSAFADAVRLVGLLQGESDARRRYDWSTVTPTWIDLLQNVVAGRV